MIKNILILLIPLFSYSQLSKITGKVKTTQNNVIEGANIILKGLKNGSISNSGGEYEIKNIKKGDYTLIVSHIGYKNQEKKIRIIENENLEINFVLSSEENKLQEVEITGRKKRAYKNSITFAATKTATKIINIPQAISYVTKEIFEDQQAYRVNDIIKNISGVNQFSWYDDFSIRGFRSGKTYINGLRVIGLFGPKPLLVNLEKVEVLKGPASAIFGNASPGGTMNRVTKKPLAENRKAINFTTGSFNTLRTTLDFTGPLNSKKTLLYRLNIGYENSDSYRDIQENKSLLISPSISFLPTEKTSINFDLVIQNFNGKLDRGQPIFGATANTKLGDPANTPIKFAIGEANDYHKSDINYFTLSLNHKFNKNISFNSSYIKYITEEDLFEHRTSNIFALDNKANEIPTLMGMKISARINKRISDNISNFFVFKTNTGLIKHKILLGFDFAQQKRVLGGAYISTGKNEYLKKNGTIGKYNPLKISEFKLDKDGNPIPNIPHFNLKNPSYVLAYPSDYILQRKAEDPLKYYTTGYYLQDQITIKKFKLLLGLRFNDYIDIEKYDKPDEKEIKQKKIIPRIGLVYSLKNNINLYGTYTESFEPQSISRVGIEHGGPFDPKEARMFEVGAKGEFINKNLSINIATYDIMQKKELVKDPNDSEKYIQTGKTSSKGIELDIQGKINQNFSLISNYAFNISKFEFVPEKYFKKGDLRPNSPKHQGGIFIKYTILNGSLKGISINYGTNFVSERNSTNGPQLKFPSYVVSDLGLKYKINKFVLRGTINNIFNKTHWVGGYNYVRLFPGAPRNYLLSVGYAF